MPDKLTILKHQLDLQLDAAMATLMEMRKEATKLQRPGASMQDFGNGNLTNEEIAKLLNKRERTILRKHKSS